MHLKSFDGVFVIGGDENDGRQFLTRQGAEDDKSADLQVVAPKERIKERAPKTSKRIAAARA